MASSSIITSINSALDDVDFLLSQFSRTVRENDIFKKQRYRLRNLKTFVLCATKLSNDVHLRSNDNKNEDGSLGSLLIRIKDAVGRNARKIHFCCHKLKDPGTDIIRSFDAYRAAKRIASGFQSDIQSSKEKIDEWYITMSDYMPQSSSLTTDKVVEFTESILENLVDFPFTSFSKIKVKPMEALREHMKFLTDFCRFVTKSGVEHGQMEDLLTHTEAVAVNAAHLCFLCGADNDDEEWRKGMQSKISILLQKIKPIDRQVYETYNQALSCSKFSRRLRAPTQDTDADSTIVLKNFVDSLISILWEMLRLDTCRVVSSKDHGQVLHEELRSLRTILNKLPTNIDEKTWGDIGVVVCDAGVLVCSFYQKNADLGLEDLLERIKLLRAEVKEKVPQTSRFKSPRIHNELGFVDLLLENLMEMKNDKVEPIVNSSVQTIKEELLYFRSFLGEIVELRHKQKELQAFWDRVLEALYGVELLIDRLVVGDISNTFSMQCDPIMEDIQNIKTDALKSFYGKRQDIKVQKVTRTYSHVPSQIFDSITAEVVGFRDEALSIMYRLTRGLKQLRVIAIVGMGGQGKTTLAAKVYNDPLVVHHFHVRAWCCVSRTLDKKALLLELLNQIHAEKYSEMTEEDLAGRLWLHLKARRYLIVLDDIWDTEAWNSLRQSFPEDLTGSRIILTSRFCDIAPLDMLDREPHILRQLSKDESLELLQSKLFPGKVWPTALWDLGIQIAENCKGLPLTIVIVAGLLAATEQEGWKEIVDSLSSGIVSSTEQCMNTLELSYQHLPDYLKPCLLYFVAFPEDKEISVRRLIRLWIAEGFVQKSKLKSLEDVAEDYVMDLTGRSFIMVAQQRSIGGVKSCRIHDLLHDLFLRKVKDEHFFHLLKGRDTLLDFNESGNLRRLCIHSEPEHFKESKLFCPRARSLIFFSQKRRWYRKEASIDISFVIHIFKLVRVLDLKEIYLGNMFPREIELLVQLRYLAIRGKIRVIPPSVGNLSMLETLVVDSCGEEVTFPDTIWNLSKLQYVFIISFGGGSFPITNLDNNSVLYELDRLSGAVFICRGSMEKQMRKFPNIRKLKCMLFEHWDDAEEFQNIVVPDFLSRLESLDMSPYGYPPKNIEFCLPANLRKLTLRGFGLPWSKISTIGKLPNLEVLKLLSDSFRGKTWEMEEWEFPKLRYLKLFALDIVRWIGYSDDQFPCLQKLVLERCLLLKELPFCLECCPTLEMIEVSNCSNATRSIVEHIEEEQVCLGNSAMKVIIHSDDFVSDSSDDFE